MKIIPILALLVLCGCAAQPSLEELEDEALITGDWSRVESFERKLARNDRTNGLDCPRTFVEVCRESGLTTKCSCQPSKGRRTPGMQ